MHGHVEREERAGERRVEDDDPLRVARDRDVALVGRDDPVGCVARGGGAGGAHGLVDRRRAAGQRDERGGGRQGKERSSEAQHGSSCCVGLRCDAADWQGGVRLG
ncbi:hypothetical protein D3C74_367980 [compost metagenome]